MDLTQSYQEHFDQRGSSYGLAMKRYPGVRQQEFSQAARFLDGYLATHNSTDHKGMYLDDHTLMELSTAGWTIQSNCAIDFHWVFPDRHAMGAFCHEFFDLRTSSVTDTQAAIEAQLGVKDLLDGSVGMVWPLTTTIAQKP